MNKLQNSSNIVIRHEMSFTYMYYRTVQNNTCCYVIVFVTRTSGVYLLRHGLQSVMKILRTYNSRYNYINNTANKHFSNKKSFFVKETTTQNSKYFFFS